MGLLEGLNLTIRHLKEKQQYALTQGERSNLTRTINLLLREKDNLQGGLKA
jgi:hypothetical protein